MANGYAGKWLFIDLTSGSIEKRDLTEEMARLYIGGYGIGARVLYDTMKPGADPLGPDNVLGFVTGPLTGSGAAFGSRYVVVCKSPVTGGWNDANSGGYFGTELKSAGYDAVFVRGTSTKPVYIWIRDEAVEIRDATQLWGKDTTETVEALIEETSENKLRAALIGPAGEKGSLLSCVINEYHRAAGRGGAGAVMGSKNLKAVAVRGTGRVAVADRAKLDAVNKSIRTGLKEGPLSSMAAGFGEHGTGGGTDYSAMGGDSPVKNWGGVGGVDFAQATNPKLGTMVTDPKYKTKKYACFACPLACGADYTVKEGRWPLENTFRAEYETLASFGTLLLNDSAESVIKCNDICNRYGLDTISTGATIAWAMECYEHGLITKEMTDGIELKWGSAEAIVDMTQAIGDRAGFGDILAMGSAGAAAKLGVGKEYLQVVKGVELPMHDSRFAPGFGRTYQSDPTPARHVKGGLGYMQLGNLNPARYNTQNTGMMDKMLSCGSEFLNITGICSWVNLSGVRDAVGQLVQAVTGWTVDQKEQTAIGHRVMNLRQAFNLREGLKPADFVLPARAIGVPPQKEGPLAGVTIGIEALNQNFFRAMEWDLQTGKPSRESLTVLGGLDDVVADLYA